MLKNINIIIGRGDYVMVYKGSPGKGRLCYGILAIGKPGEGEVMLWYTRDARGRGRGGSKRNP